MHRDWSALALALAAVVALSLAAAPAPVVGWGIPWNPFSNPGRLVGFRRRQWRDLSKDVGAALSRTSARWHGAVINASVADVDYVFIKRMGASSVSNAPSVLITGASGLQGLDKLLFEAELPGPQTLQRRWLGWSKPEAPAAVPDQPQQLPDNSVPAGLPVAAVPPQPLAPAEPPVATVPQQSPNNSTPFDPPPTPAHPPRKPRSEAERFRDNVDDFIVKLRDRFREEYGLQLMRVPKLGDQMVRLVRKKLDAWIDDNRGQACAVMAAIDIPIKAEVTSVVAKEFGNAAAAVIKQVPDIWQVSLVYLDQSYAPYAYVRETLYRDFLALSHNTVLVAFRELQQALIDVALFELKTGIDRVMQKPCRAAFAIGSGMGTLDP